MKYTNVNYNCVPNDALYTMYSKVILFHSVKKAATVKCSFLFPHYSQYLHTKWHRIVHKCANCDATNIIYALNIAELQQISKYSWQHFSITTWCFDICINSCKSSSDLLSILQFPLGACSWTPIGTSAQLGSLRTSGHVPLECWNNFHIWSTSIMPLNAAYACLRFGTEPICHKMTYWDSVPRFDDLQ